VAEAAGKGDRMNRIGVPRWAVSFADLALLLLAFFVLMRAGDSGQVVAGARAAFLGEDAVRPLLAAPAATLFEPGEARLRAAARARLVGIGRQAAHGDRRLVIESLGRDSAGHRLDAWELAAARAAALARALQDGGIGEKAIRIVMPPDEGGQGQRLVLRHGA
jgi:flagellar motor protein MotB